MIRKCKNSCEAICGFCTYYNNGKCEITNIDKKKYNICNCDMFSCFTLENNYKEKDYLTVEYIIKSYEGEM